ncbi:MAG: hypothetical protein ORN49_13455 [Rhodobacteraceae bacterium]|nr:hypothetical protein [Paracoccaceae bacterium]
MLTLPDMLPSGALLGQEEDALVQALSASGAHWFSPLAEFMDGGADQPVTGLRPLLGYSKARPCDANSGRGAAGIHLGLPVLTFTTGVNGGFIAPAVAPNAERFTLAVVYAAPEEDARTLATLSFGQGESRNIFFLSHSEGLLVAKDREGGISAELPCPSRDGRFHLAIASWDGERLVLMQGESRAESRGTLALAGHAVDLFIGCRGHRKGLIKLLGAGLIADVFFWPDQALLSTYHMADPHHLPALQSYFRWHY